jgi:hypothetical protein
MEAVAMKGFQRYSDKVVASLYDETSRASGEEGGLANFFASQILTDEVIAQRSVDATNPASLLIVLTEVDRVKFGFGCQFRLERLLTLASGEKAEVALMQSSEPSLLSDSM